MDKEVRKVRLVLVGAVVALASLVSVSPAIASEAEAPGCEAELAAVLAVPDPTGAGIVVIGTSIEVRPQNAVTYSFALINHLSSTVPAYGACLAAGPQALVDELVREAICAARSFNTTWNPNGGYFGYFSVDTNTGAVAIHHTALLADIREAALCFITIHP